MGNKLTNKNINETITVNNDALKEASFSTTVKGDLNEASLSTGKYKINPEVEQALLEMSVTVKTEGVTCGQTGEVSGYSYAMNERGSFAQLGVVYKVSGDPNVPAQHSFKNRDGYNTTVFSSRPEDSENPVSVSA